MRAPKINLCYPQYICFASTRDWHAADLFCIVGNKAVRYSIVWRIGIRIVTQLGQHWRDFVHLVHDLLDQGTKLDRVAHLWVGADPGSQSVEVDGLDDLVAGPLHHGHPHL